ncbi:MAG TPA: hypothetical protein VE999_01180 [Gemmataceae bacterium]|nr:hypothetical protein [Gemmataceae bacterium]
MHAMIIVTGTVITLLALAALWQLVTGQQKPEPLEAVIKRTAEASLPGVEEAIRQFAEQNPEAIRKGCQLHISVRPCDNSRLPPEYLKAFEKAGGGNGQAEA